MDDESKVAFWKMTIGGILSSITALTLSQWVAVVTIAYFVLQIGLLVPKYLDLFKRWRKR